jgi:glutathione S-transferase
MDNRTPDVPFHLYYAPRTRAVRPRWLLEEIGAPFTLVRVDLASKQNRTPEFLALNPLGHVPVLVDRRSGRDIVVCESAAICLYLADTISEAGMAPPVGSPERAAYLQWMLFAMTTLEQPATQFFEHSILFPPEERHAPLVTKARARWDEVTSVLEGVLAPTPFLVGSKLTAADICVGSILAWGQQMGMLGARPALTAYVDRLLRRSAAQRAHAD